jgi:hypothetical protein
MIAWLFLVALLLLPPASVAALGARRRRKRPRAPGFAVWFIFALLGWVGILALVQIVSFAVLVRSVEDASVKDPSQKARVLAEGISEAMNCGAAVLLVLLGVGGGFVVWRWIRLARAGRK